MQNQLNIFTKVFRAGILLFATMFFSIDGFSQPSVKIGELTTCSNIEFLIQLNIEDFNDVAAFTLFIDIDTAYIDYVDIENVNEIFSTGDFIGGINYENQLISLNWFSLTPANIDSGVMCNMRVVLKKGSASLSFNENCEFVRPDLSIIEDVIYQNGLVTALNSYEIIPISQSVLEGGQVNIEILDIPEEVSCIWQIMENDEWFDLDNEPPYSGVLTSMLSIESVSLELNEKSFRCLLSNEICAEVSGISYLTVTPNGISNSEGLETNSLFVYPNPVKDKMTCLFNKDVHFAGLNMVNLQGNSVLQKQIGNVSRGEETLLRTDNLKSGIYFLQLTENGKIITSLKIIKE